MKRMITAILVVALCLSLANFAAADFEIETEENFLSDKFISQSLTLNSNLMADTFSLYATRSTIDVPADCVSLSISQDHQFAMVQLEYNGTAYNGTLPGHSDSISTNSLNGYVGVFEGEIYAISEYGEQYEPIHLIIDVTYSKTEIFAALTFGLATETEDPLILFFGDLSSNLGTISTAYSTQLRNTYLNQNEETNSISLVSPAQTTVDATMTFQEYDSYYLGSYKVGALSIFHANELENQNEMTVRAKANSNTDNFVLYLQDHYGYSASQVSYAVPDEFNIFIRGNHDDLHVATNSYYPQEEETSVDLTVPYWIASTMEVETIEIPVIVSTITVTETQYSSDSNYRNNGIEWELYKSNGFGSDDMDGDHTTRTGMAVEASYTYEGNVTSEVTRSMNSTASIQYLYLLNTGEDIPLTLHLSTGTMSTISYVTVLP